MDDFDFFNESDYLYSTEEEYYSKTSYFDTYPSLDQEYINKIITSLKLKNSAGNI